MKVPTFNPSAPDGFTINEPAKVLTKLQRFAQAGAGHTYFLFDFDRTLTTSKHTGDNTTTWEIMHGLLPLEGQKTNNAIRDKYLSLESAGLLSSEDSHRWLSSQLDLHKMHGTSAQNIKRAAKAVRLRDGSREVFDACSEAHIPTVILSAGIRDIIELIMAEHSIHPSELLSVKLQFASNGRIIGWDKDSTVLANNKRETVKQQLSHITAARPYVVLIGDTTDDARMVDGDDTVLRVRVWDPQEGERSDAYLKQSFKAGYDMVVDEDLSPLAPLISWLNGVRG
ncbi:MAG TPA: HAD-IB family phosphatase [Patescibacteria group bacterium]|nr:HAD-IB family phosphatase [Patescibacteria group bacterium]